MKLQITWVELETIILGEAIQIQKDKHCTLSLISGHCLLFFSYVCFI